MKYTGKTNEYFEVRSAYSTLSEIEDSSINDLLSIIWFQENNNKVVIDNQEYNFNANQILCLTQFHNIDLKSIGKVNLLRFNSPFYCILNHDEEVSCKGLLFFGSRNVPIISPSEEDLKIFNTVWEMIEIEMKSADNLQLEMLQMMLKRWLILCTRVYKKQQNYAQLDKKNIDLVSEFNYLVEQFFKTKHTVSEYAQILNKSPKTLSNLFKKLHDKTPLQLIQNRIMLEARRQIKYSDESISEIAYGLGFNDIQSFSRFFKKNEGVSPSAFKQA